MALVPQNLEEFQTAEFWDGFFRARKEKPFEWYCDYAALKQKILQRCHGKTILIPGCGNSDLSALLSPQHCPLPTSQLASLSYDDGVTNITNVDFSKPVIREMLGKNVRKRPQMKWLVMDITQMKVVYQIWKRAEGSDVSSAVQFDEGAFDVVLDKGALDALMGDCEADSTEKAEQYLQEVHSSPS